MVRENGTKPLEIFQFMRYCREKKWVQLVDTTMKVYKWIPVTTMPQEGKKMLKQLDPNQNSMSDKENSKLTNDLAEDSNTCKFDRFMRLSWNSGIDGDFDFDVLFTF
jgi:hypothetical protein